MAPIKVTTKSIVPNKQKQDVKKPTTPVSKSIVQPTSNTTIAAELTDSTSGSDDSTDSSEDEDQTLVSIQNSQPIKNTIEPSITTNVPTPAILLAKPSTKTIRFSFKSREYSFLSNFYVVDINIDGKVYFHVEGYYQSRRFAGFNERAAEHIRFLADPIIAKKRVNSYQISEEKNEQWIKGKRDIVMNRGILAKFICSAELTKKLIDTGDSILESIDSDEYWGMGDNNKGVNKLGKILMHTRSLISEILS